MTNAEILQRVYIHLGSEEQTGLVEPIVLAMADLAYIDLARFLIDTDAELAKKLIKQVSDQTWGTTAPTIAYSSADSGTGVITVTNTNLTLLNGMRVNISGTAGGGALSASTTYFVRDATSTGIKLSATLGGPALTGFTGSGTITILNTSSTFEAPADMLFHVQKPVLRLEIGGQLAFQLQDRDKLNMLGSALTNIYYALEGKTFFIRHFTINDGNVNTADVTSGSNLSLRYYRVPTAADIDDELAPIFLDMLFKRLSVAMQTNAVGMAMPPAAK